MIGRTFFALAAALPLLSAPAGAATAPAPVSGTEAAETMRITASPASILITVELSSLARTVAYTEDDGSVGNISHLAVYFAPGSTRPGEEAQLALAALADEVAVNATLLLTVTATADEGISADMQEARAISVFNTLGTLGVPMRAMALDLNSNADAGNLSGVLANAI